MIRRLTILAMATLLLAACANYRDTTRERLETLPQHYSQFDLLLAWETKVVGDQTLIEGVAKNVRYANMYDLEIWVSVLDPAGKMVARSMTFVIPTHLRLDDSAEFGLKLPVAVAPGTRLRFTYKYRGDDGGNDGLGGTDWMQSFDAVVPGR